MLGLIFAFIVTLLLVEWINRKPRNYPPGPPILPFIGSSPFVQIKNFHLYLENVKEKYGSVIGFKFGPKFIVAVRGAKEVKEVLSREEFQGRPFWPTFEPGLMFSEGEFWSAQRRFTVKHLRDFGFGKKTVEHVVLQEAEEFFDKVLRKTDMIQVSGLFSVSSINVLWAMMGGERYSHDDKDFKEFLNSITKIFRNGNVTGGSVDIYPILGKLFPNVKSIKEQVDRFGVVHKFLERAIDTHKKTRTETPRDLIDVYLAELEKTDIHSSFSELTLRNVCNDLFSAGTESVGNSLSFCLLYCVLYPEWQEKVYEDIKNFDTSVPYLSNTEKLSKVTAFISEVTRCNTIASLTVPHKAIKDTQLNDCFIPKDTMVIVSLWSVLQDKELWKDPENFRPERFLDENGNYNKEAGWLPAFGYGKRKCPGETLAKDMTLVYFISLIREFKFSLPEGHPKPSTVCLPGFTNAPQPFFVKITKR